MSQTQISPGRSRLRMRNRVLSESARKIRLGLIVAVFITFANANIYSLLYAGNTVIIGHDEKSFLSPLTI